LYNRQWPILLHTVAGCGKQPELLEHGVILLQDNAVPHRQYGVQRMVQQCRWEVLAHLPYSADLATCDSWLFAHVKEHLWS